MEAQSPGVTRGPSACRCRIVSASWGLRIDSSQCIMNPVLEAWRKIERRAEELAREGSATPTVSPKTEKRKRTTSGKTWEERWAPVKQALAEVDRAMEEQQIPRGLLTCGFCSKLIESGILHTFHGDCYDQRFEPSVDIRQLKDEVRRILRPGHPARELTLALPDKISKVEMPGCFLAILHLLQASPS